MTSYNLNEQWYTNTQTKLPIVRQYTFWLTNAMVGQYDAIYLMEYNNYVNFRHTDGQFDRYSSYVKRTQGLLISQAITV